jgi:uncharacterized phage protein gp47/JayE
MSYGVLTTGFSLKRFEDIKLEIEYELREKFGEIDTDADSVFGQINGVYSRHLAELWEQAENIYNSMYPSTAEGVSLDNAASFVGVKRLAATPSTVVIQLLGDESTLVLQTTAFSQSVSLKVFETLNDITITAANLHKTVISIDSAVTETWYRLTINGILIEFKDSGTPTKASIAEELKTLINASVDLNEDVLASYTTDDEFFTVTTKDFTLVGYFVVTALENISFEELWTPVAVEASEDGAIPVPIGSIDTIDTPVFGLSDVINFADGITGTNLETDAELRIRRRNSLNVVAAGTLSSILSRIEQDIPEVSKAFIFENNTDVEDAFGRPPHSFEVVVAALDTVDINLSIALKIWERKPAGIATFGTTSVIVQDSNGDNQVINFSHSITRYVHIKLEYDRTNADSVFPLNGEDLIKEEIMRVGNLLTFGADLLVQVFAACGYIAGGVTEVTPYVAVTDNPLDPPAWQTTNLSIDPADLPSFDLSRITLIDVT